MKICEHYEKNKRTGKYESLVKQIKKHEFECCVCKVKLHDVDVTNLNNYIRYLNSKDDPDYMESGREDIYEMLRPIPRQY